MPEEDKKALDSAFKSSKNTKERSRIQVIRLLSKGFTHKEVRRVTLKSGRTIEDLVTQYNQHGINGLHLAPHPKNNSKLTTKQKDRIKEILATTASPSEVGIKVDEEYDFWSIPTLRLLVKKLFRVEYKSKESYRKLFNYGGYSYKKVEFEDERRSSEKAEDFQKRFQMKLKRGAMSMWW